jgi:hypothetical protein
MSIIVTPIPRIIDLATPAFTLGTANSAGTAQTAVASDSTLLVFDTTNPAAVAASAAVGSATVSARRDHVHAGTTATGTVVDEAITRFDGTGGASLQGYSSLSPTISDTGIISLTSGALKWPATAIASGNANTLDDYEEGTWTPVIGGDGGTSGQNYGAQIGIYVKIGKLAYCAYDVLLSTEGTITGNVEIQGLPFPVQANSGSPALLGRWSSLATNWVELNVIAASGGSTALVRGTTAAGSSSNTSLTASDINNTTRLSGVILYGV